MQDAMFSSLFGALTTEHRMSFIANNLANDSEIARDQTGVQRYHGVLRAR